MNTRLFVGGIAWATTEDALKQAFSQAGQVVSVQILQDRATGRSRGFGFVEMSNAQDAQKAIEMWNGKALDGRTLVVNEARPQADRPQRSAPGPYRDETGGRDW